MAEVTQETDTGSATEGAPRDWPDDLAAASAAAEEAGAVAAQRAQELIDAARARGERMEHEARERATDLELGAGAAVDRVLEQIELLGARLNDLEAALGAGNRTAVALPGERLVSQEAPPEERRAAIAAPDRAGSAVRERAEAVLGAVKAAVDDLEQTVTQTSTESWREADGKATATLDSMVSLADELRASARAIGTETDSLRRRLLEARSAHGADDRPGAAPGEQLEGASASPAGPEELAEGARRRVARKTELELAELFAICADRSANGPDGERDYWRALGEAAVEEAAGRPDLASDDDEAAGWRERRRRRKALAPLLRARDEAVAAPSDEAPDRAP